MRHEGSDIVPSELPLTQAQRLRIRFILWVFLAAFGYVALQLIHLQAFPDPRFLKNENHHVGEVPLNMPRGIIYDREGRTLARERRVPSLYAYPSFLNNPHEAAQRLSVRLGVDEDDLINRFTRVTKGGQLMEEVPVKRWLTEEQVESVGDLNAWGEKALRIKYEPARYYPEGPLAAHVLGFVSPDQSVSDGIELKYDKYLRSVPGKQVSRVDGRRTLLSSHTIEFVAPEGGNDLYLTIDKGMQSILERELANVMELRQAGRAMGIVMDPKTGAILAMACLPAFDPNAYSEYPSDMRVNAAVSLVFEPGSAFKIVTAAAAIENGLCTPETLIDCEGGAWNALGLRRIRDVHKMGTVTFAEAFAESSNVAIIKVARDLMSTKKRDELDAWIRRFGFGEKTSPDFFYESRGLYKKPANWSKLSEIALPMGQEIAVTMPQLARAFAAIANGGYLVDPYVVERAVGPDNTVTYQSNGGNPRRIMSERTAAIMRDLCYGVVAHGTGRRAAIPEYRVGGKTGTAQVARPAEEGGGYYTDRHTAVFAGFGPIADPRLVAVIVVCNPQSEIYYGGYVCGPVFKAVMRDCLVRLECPQDPMEPGTYQPSDENADADVLVAQAAPEDGPAPGPATASAAVASGSGANAESEQLPAPPADLIIGPGQLPNMVGMTKRQVKEKLAALGVEWDSQGSGWVVVQEPAPGTPLTDVPLCHLVFSNARTTSPVPVADTETSTPATLAARETAPSTP